MTDLLDLTYKEAVLMLASYDVDEYRAAQLFDWIYKKRAKDISVMTNLPAGLRQKLLSEYYIGYPVIIERIKSQKDGTVKYLLELSDKEHIETVLMRYEHGYSLCISSQVGCRMGCDFCASAKAGYIRNLCPGEFTGQIMAVEEKEDIRISNITVMGIGEPLDNFDNLLRFIYTITDAKGIGIGIRNISISTCGIAEKIYALADLGIKINIALSLHTPFDEKRKMIMPVAKRYSIAELISAMDYFFEKTKRRPTYEYTLIRDLNDTYEDALSLSLLLKGKNAHVNLISLNKTDGDQKTGSDKVRMYRFMNVLIKHGIEVTIRRRLGMDIDAACGQLRRNRSIK